MANLLRVSGTRIVKPNGWSTTIASRTGSVNIVSTSTNLYGVLNVSSNTNIYGSIQVQGTHHTIIMRADDGNVTNTYDALYDPRNIYGNIGERLKGALYVAGGVGIEKDLNVGGYIYGRVSQANTSLQLVITSTNVDHVFYPIFTETPNGGGYIYSDTTSDKSGLTYNPSIGLMTIESLNIGSTATSTSYSSGAVVISGGVGIGGNLWTGQDITVNRLTIGQGYQGQNNIVIQGQALPEINQFPNGQSSISVGYNTLSGIGKTYGSVALGNYALSTGTNLTNEMAMGNHSLEKLGTVPFIASGNLTNATLTKPVTITVSNHNIQSGTHVLIERVYGMLQLNGQTYYVNAVDTNTLALYYDVNFSNPVDGTSFAAYSSGGLLSVSTVNDSNTGIGNYSGNSLIDGVQNFFIGNHAGDKLVQGSYNILIGHHVAGNLTNGNSNLSINGNNLVDGMSNQINIGPVFYYDGLGSLRLSANTAIGLGAASTSTQSGALIVNGGMGINQDLNVGGTVYTSTASIQDSINMADVAGIHSNTYGNPDENYLIYTPRITASTTPPGNPRVGDYYIHTTSGIEYQCIMSNGVRIWVQFGQAV
jgi:hypothetical protein